MASTDHSNEYEGLLSALAARAVADTKAKYEEEGWGNDKKAMQDYSADLLATYVREALDAEWEKN